MKKNFKKIFGFCLFVAIATFLSLGTINQNYSNFASATTNTKSYSYTIENNSTYIKVTGTYTSNSEDETYTLGTSYTSFQTALEGIITDSDSETSVTINFDNFVLLESEPTITLESNLNFTFTGNISSAYAYPVFEIYTTYANNIDFQNIVITNNASSHIIEIADSSNKTDKNRVYISFENTNLYSSVSESYAIYLTSFYVSLSFGESFNYSSTYLYNYLSNVSATLESTFSFDNTSIDTSTINITVPYDVTTDDGIINASSSLKQYINFVPLSDFYTFSNPTNNNSTFYASPAFYTDFDENGGTYNDFTEITSIEKYSKKEVSFPSSSDILNEHYTFVGWFGKLVFSSEEVTTYGLSSNTWYFDSEMLENFAEVNFNLYQISNYFVTNLDELDTERSFSSYVYDSTGSNYETCLHATFFTNLEKIPTYIAVWSDVYEISFESNGGTAVESIIEQYGTSIKEPTSPTKEGYTFDGWYTSSSLDELYVFSTMPDENITLYAKWSINSITITFVLNNGGDDIVLTGNYQDVISYPEEDPELIGYTFLGWVDENNITFSETYFGSESKTVYANWEHTLYTISYDSDGGGDYSDSYAYYGDLITEPETPSKEGYTFASWYTDSSHTIWFNFESDTMPAQDLTLYANWIKNQYTISFVTNTTYNLDIVQYYYGDTINSFSTLTKTDYNFVDWYLDRSFETVFSYTTMPAQDLTLYALWKEKQTVEIDLSSQTYSINDNNLAFRNFCSLIGFSVTYLVDGSWTSEIPVDAGTYDVKITRAEDSTYKSFSTIIENGLVIEPEVVDILWLIVILFCFAFFELIVVLIIKYLQRLRTTKLVGIAFSLLIAANRIISNNQIVLLIVSGALALAGFVLMILELVKWHRSNVKYYLDGASADKNKEFELDEEFEERFKIKRDDSKYKDYIFSQEDIEEMLKNPNYFNENNKLKDSENKKYNDIHGDNKDENSEEINVIDLIDDDNDTNLN